MSTIFSKIRLMLSLNPAKFLFEAGAINEARVPASIFFLFGADP